MFQNHIYKILNINDNKYQIKLDIKLQYSNNLHILSELADDLEIFYNILTNYNFNSILYLNSISKYEGEIPDNILKIISQHNALIIGNYYQVKLNNLPKNLKLIYISSQNYYIHEINNLPMYLEHLIMYTGYNYLVDCLPYGLKTFEIHGYFNMPLHNLPPTLKILYVGSRYNQPLINLPPYLDELILSDYYQHELKNLPLKLKKLYVGFDYYLPLVNIPDSVETLTISGSPEYIDKLPISLKTFNIGYDANFYCILTDTIEEISVTYNSLFILYNLLDEYIPKNLKTIFYKPSYTFYEDTYLRKINETEYSILDNLRLKYPNYNINFI